MHDARPERWLYRVRRGRIALFNLAIAIYVVTSGSFPEYPAKSLAELTIADSVAVIVLAVICHGCVFIASIWIPPLWQQITPIRDRVTHIEGEIVFTLGAIAGGMLCAVMLTGDLFRTFAACTSATFLSIPFSFAHWCILCRLDPLDTDTAHARGDEVRAQLRNKHFVSNGVAYLLSGVVTTFAFCLFFASALVGKLGLEDGMLLIGSFLAATWACLLVSALGGACIVAVGRRIAGCEERNVGRHYLIGHIALLGIGVIFATCFDYARDKSLERWEVYTAAALMLAFAYCAGAFVLSKLYRYETEAPISV